MAPFPGSPLPVRLLLTGLVASLAITVLVVTTGLAPAAWNGPAGDVVYHGLLLGSALACLLRGVRPHGRPWLAIGLALAVWSAGDLYWLAALADLEDPPYPSIADALWLAFYPPAFLGVVLLARRSAPALDRRLWLDGCIGALAAGALGALVMLDVLVAGTEGDVADVAVNLAYPLADTVLLGLVVGVLVATRGHAARAWLLLAVGIACFTVADAVYLVLVATDTYQDGHVVDLGWITAAVLIAVAAWRPQPAAVARQTLRGTDTGVLVPVALAISAVALLTVTDPSGGHLPGTVLAVLALFGVLARLWMTQNDLRSTLGRARQQALSDPLTGIANRAALLRDLERRGRRPGTAMLALFDLDGFKTYNDTFGHLAGDELLRRLARRLEIRAADLGGRAYRIGGDEFCVLVDVDDDGVDPLLSRLGAALADRGEGFEVSASVGHAVLPAEGPTASDALGCADRRMYARKRSGRVPVTGQVTAALVAAMEARDLGLADHMHQVAALARLVAAELGLEAEAAEQVGRAAELHDIGKLAIPDAVLHKPGPLTDEEWRFVRTHTLIGERILAAAPLLTDVGRLVRSAHERHDGAGYPDGLAGDEIPLGSQIVFVCDTYDAMTSTRPYAAAIPPEAVLQELRRCAGSQFAPRVVDAFWAVHGRLDAADLVRSAAA